MYRIKKLQKTKAKELGVEIKPSKLKGKKIDVFKNNKKIASIGAKGYKDYATWIELKGIVYALERRKLYRARHKHTINIKGSNSYYANKILW
jgi:hypothetical protein